MTCQTNDRVPCRGAWRIQTALASTDQSVTHNTLNCLDKHECRHYESTILRRMNPLAWILQ